MGRKYRVPFVATTVTAAGGNTDLWEFIPTDDKPIHLIGFTLGQTSEVGDAVEEGIDITIIYLGATVTGGNGTTVVPVAIDLGGNVAAGFAAEINATTVATTNGTATIMDAMAWNNRNTPYERWFSDPEWAPLCRQGSALVIRMNTTLADDMTFVGCAYIEED